MTATLEPPVAGPASGRRRRLAVGVVVTLVVLVAVATLPTRSWLAQQEEIRQTREELVALEDTNDDLAARLERLSSDDAIERQAREEFGLVYPGEESYSVLAPSAPLVALPEVWPFDLLQEPLARAAARQGAPATSGGGGDR